MSLKVKEKIFPNFNNIDMEKLKYDSEGLYSISHPEDAEFISEEIKKFKGLVIWIYLKVQQDWR